MAVIPLPMIPSTATASYKSDSSYSNKQLPLPHPRLRPQSQSQSQSLVMETAETSIDSSAAPPRRLILLRHAKSSSQDRSLRDHDRPLSKAGENDALKVSYKLQQLGWIPELILSSDARRTRETLKIMQEQVPGFLGAEVHFISSFYSVAAMDGQTAEHLQQIICKYSRDEILTVMCMGHNRGWEEAASTFSGTSVELKTCNAALLEATGNSWEENWDKLNELSTEKQSGSSKSASTKSGCLAIVQKAFSLAGHGGWKLQNLVKPNATL